MRLLALLNCASRRQRDNGTGRVGLVWRTFEMLSKQTRRRFLLNTGMLAAGSELSCADVVLSQELAPTPSCHDGHEPTVRETEGRFLSQDRRSAVTCASLALEAAPLNFLALC